MNRAEFKEKLADTVDGVIDTDRTLDSEDEANLISTFGDVASEIIDAEGDDEAEGEADEG